MVWMTHHDSTVSVDTVTAFKRKLRKMDYYVFQVNLQCFNTNSLLNHLKPLLCYVIYMHDSITGGNDCYSRWCNNLDLSVLTRPPSAIAKDHGIGPSRYLKSFSKLISCCYESNKFLSALICTDFFC